MNNKWYQTGLHFECLECGQCCSGPEEGYIWITKPEIKLLAEFLDIKPEHLVQKYLKHIGRRTTIIEERRTKDCIFLETIDDQRRCSIYPVRPNQCRTWPFWPDNIATVDDWNLAGQKCPGINRGKGYTAEEIEKIKTKKSWW